MSRQLHGLVLLLALAAVALPAARSEQTAPPPAARPALPGLPNFAQVSTNLYRGAQPDSRGYESLAALGVRTIVNLRSAHDDDLPDDTTLRSIRIPMKADRPNLDEVRDFLRTVCDPANQPAFVHCRRGADRTGLMVAAYRIVVQDWDKAKAIEEMKNGGYKFFEGYQDIVDLLKNLDVPALRAELALAPAPP